MTLFSSCPLQQQMTMSPTKQQPLYFNRHFYKKDNICDFSFTLMSSEILSKRSYYLTDKNSPECYVAPALCLHIMNSMKASVWHIF